MIKLRNFIVGIIKNISLFITISLGLRFALKLFDISFDNIFLNFIFNFSQILLKPLPDFFQPLIFGNKNIIEIKTIFAIFFYLIGNFILIGIVYYIFDPFIIISQNKKSKNNFFKTEEKTIMLTDIIGFTSSTARKSRHGLIRYVFQHLSLITPIIKKYKGKIIKTMGDAFLVTFTSPTNAALCGLEIQKKLKEYNLKKNNSKLEVRIAINCGEVNVTKNDIYGKPVNVAARVESITKPNQVYITESVFYIINKNEVKIKKIDDFKFKGIKNKIRVFKVMRKK